MRACQSCTVLEPVEPETSDTAKKYTGKRSPSSLGLHEEIIPAKHPNSDIIRTCLEIIGWVDSGRILSGFWKDSKRILKEFCKDSGRLLGGKDSDDSGRILKGLKGFCENSGRLLEESGRILMILEGF